MSLQLKIRVCSIYAREARVAADLEGLDVVLHSMPPPCSDRAASGKLPIVASDELWLTPCSCGNPRATGHCLEAIAGTDLIQRLSRKRRYAVSPGWVDQWRTMTASWGFSKEHLPEYFREFADAIVLLDTGVSEHAHQSAQEFADAAGLPLEVIDIGLAALASRLRSLVGERTWHEERQAIMSRLDGALRMNAERSMVLDLMQSMAKLQNEQRVTERIIELGRMLFGAGSIDVLQMGQNIDVPAHLSVLERWASQHDAEVEVGPTWFRARIVHANELLAVVQMGTFAVSGRVSEYASEFQRLASLCGLAISNARAFRRLEESERALAHFAESQESGTASGPIAASKTLIQEIADRQSAEDQLRHAQNQLTQRVLELERHTSQLERLASVVGGLQRGETPKQALKALSEHGLVLFGGDSGLALVFDESRHMLVQTASWGNSNLKHTPVSHEDCPAAATGMKQVLWRCKRGEFCPFAPVCAEDVLLCVPISGGGPHRGSLMVACAPERVASHTLIAQTLAEQIGLTLTNLSLRNAFKEQAVHDPLTGLHNRYALEQYLKHELSRAERRNRPVSVMMLDLDHFKAYNDQLGHLAGDRYLQKVGLRLTDMVRVGDVACRFGGEEFLLVLTEANLEVALRRADAIRVAIAELGSDQEMPAGAPPVTVSVGVATWPEHGQTSVDLIEAADRALYSAKEQGRDRVVSAGH